MRSDEVKSAEFCFAVKMLIRIFRYWLVWTRAKVLIIYQTQVRLSPDHPPRPRLLVIHP